jgi:hypothetical protein
MLRNLIQNFRTAWKLPRWRWALLVALASDAIGFGVALLPPVQWSVDAVTAIALLAVLGFRWGLLGALAIEVVPVLQLFPAWTLVVAALASTEKRQALPDPVTKVQKPPLNEINPPQKTKLTP